MPTAVFGADPYQRVPNGGESAGARAQAARNLAGGGVVRTSPSGRGRGADSQKKKTPRVGYGMFWVRARVFLKILTENVTLGPSWGLLARPLARSEIPYPTLGFFFSCESAPRNPHLGSALSARVALLGKGVRVGRGKRGREVVCRRNQPRHASSHEHHLGELTQATM